MARLTSSAVILCTLTLIVSGCSLSNYVNNSQQEYKHKLEEQAHQQKKQRTAAQDAVRASKAQSLFRACKQNGETPLHKDGEPMSKCQAIKLFIGKWQGTFLDQDCTVKLDIFGLNDATKDFLSFTAKADISNCSEAELLSGDYGVNFYPSEGIVEINNRNDQFPSSGNYLASAFKMQLARKDAKNYLSGYAQGSGVKKIPGGTAPFDIKGEVRLTHSVNNIEQIPTISVDTIFNSKAIYVGVAYWHEYIDKLVGDDIEKRLAMGNDFYKIGKCRGCPDGALRNYLFVASKVTDAEVQTRISNLYADRGDKRNANLWQDMAAPVLAQAKAICMSQPVKDALAIRIKEMNDEMSPLFYIDNGELQFSSVSEPTEVRDMSKPFICHYIVGRLEHQDWNEYPLRFTMVPAGKQRYTARWDNNSSYLEDETDLWDKVRKGNSTEDYEAYLAQYPKGKYRVLAKARLNRVFKDCADCPELVVIPEGRFTMGSQINAEANEAPLHEVTIELFAMGKTEVTQAQWQAVMGSNPSNFTSCGGNCPVEQVSWDDAQIFIKKLNAKTGKQYRLPSEAEWEYACRAGSFTYCGGEHISNVGAWYTSNSGSKTQPVGQKKANEYGLYDMSGNVWEWVADSYHDNYTGAPNDGSVWQGDGAKRVLRGGSWGSSPQLARATLRQGLEPTSRYPFLGLRVSRTLP